MKRVLVAVAFIAGVAQANAFDHTHANWTKVLKSYRVDDGRLRYRELQADFKKDASHPLATYLSDLAKVKRAEFDTWSRENRMSYLINAYNAFTVKLIVDSYPVKSIKKTVGFLRSPWKKEFFSLLEGAITSLDPIEHAYLRPQYGDARVHAAINCASLSCPVLQPTAFTPDKLDAQLDTAFRQFLADKARNRYDSDKGVLHLSKIFDWFGEDFEKSYGGLKPTLERLGPAEAKAAIAKSGKIEFLDYNWDLNDAASDSALATTASR